VPYACKSEQKLFDENKEYIIQQKRKYRYYSSLAAYEYCEEIKYFWGK
jgi:hypothetical protein